LLECWLPAAAGSEKIGLPQASRCSIDQPRQHVSERDFIITASLAAAGGEIFEVSASRPLQNWPASAARFPKRSHYLNAGCRRRICFAFRQQAATELTSLGSLVSKGLSLLECWLPQAAKKTGFRKQAAAALTSLGGLCPTEFPKQWWEM
jgi:hypothetical protein